MLDIYGNNIGGAGGYETEEEKRRRLEEEAANATPVTQTIKTNPVTGQQEMTIKGTPQDLSAANPLTPTVTGPVNPADTFGRMVQAESNGQQFNPQGGVLTSPRGAQGMAQVMPATAANPGYGVKPASPEEIATPEGNRAFGERYFQGLLQHFNGDQTKAVAAYNAGPGRVQQNVQANAGQMNPQQLPKETQGYMNKVLGAVNPIGTANAAAPAPTLQNTPLQAPAPAGQSLMPPQTAPAVNAFPGTPSAQMPGQQPAPVAPTPQPAPQAPMPVAGPVNPATPVAQAPVAQPPVEQAGPPTNLMTPSGWADRLNTARQDDRQLAGLAYDPNTPQYVREEASADLYKRLQAARTEAATNAKLQAGIASGDMSEINRIMKKDDTAGDWMKYLFFGLIGSDAAKSYRQKLFPDEGSKVISFVGQDGRQGLIRQAADGSPLFGRFDDGKELNSKQLIQYAQNLTGGKQDYVGGSVVNDKTGQIGRIVSQNGRTMIESGGRLHAPTTEWRNNTVGTDLTLAAKRAIIDMEGKSATEALSYVRKWNVEHPDARVSEDVSGISQLRTYASGSGMPPAAAPVQGGVPTAGVATGGVTAPTAEANPTVEKAKQIGREEIVKDAAKIVAEQGNTIKMLNDAQRTIGLLDSGNVNFGSIIHGQIPFEKTIANKLGTSDSKNTKDVLEYVNRIAATNAKMLGTNPTDRDLQFVTATKPNEDWGPQAVKEWIQRSETAQRRTLEIARKQVESGGRYEAPLPSEGAPGTKENPIKL
jgi:hypothetical protein